MEEAISRQAVIDSLYDWSNHSMTDAETWHLRQVIGDIKSMPSVTPKPKVGYISIDDAMSVFDDFMCGEVDEEGTETFLEMLKDKAEGSENE